MMFILATERFTLSICTNPCALFGFVSPRNEKYSEEEDIELYVIMSSIQNFVPLPIDVNGVGVVLVLLLLFYRNLLVNIIGFKDKLQYRQVCHEMFTNIHI